MTVVTAPPYSPDFAPCDFALFPRLKTKLYCHHFYTIEVFEEQSKTVLNTFSEYDFQDAFKKWKKG
jgi:hypothetical protein